MSHQIAGPAAEALASLAPAQLAFLHALPKAELHAHLNGSIPLPVLHALAESYVPDAASPDAAAVRAGLAQLQRGVTLDAIGDFFGLFPAIYALTATPPALARGRLLVGVGISSEFVLCMWVSPLLLPLLQCQIELVPHADIVTHQTQEMKGLSDYFYSFQNHQHRGGLQSYIQGSSDPIGAPGEPCDECIGLICQRFKI